MAEKHEIDAIVNKIEATTDLHATKLGDEYSYNSLPLCVIDAVFSIGVGYKSTSRTVKTWCDAQQPPWLRYKSEGGRRYSLSDFCDLLGQWHGKNVFDNRQRTSTRNGILKSDAVQHFARTLLDCHIDDFRDIDDENRIVAAEAKVRQLPGQGSGISFKYFLMLAGSDDLVKADRMLCRYVASAIGVKTVSAEKAERLVHGAAQQLKKKYPQLTPKLLDYAIWSYQRTTARPAHSGS